MIKKIKNIKKLKKLKKIKIKSNKKTVTNSHWPASVLIALQHLGKTKIARVAIKSMAFHHKGGEVLTYLEESVGYKLYLGSTEATFYLNGIPSTVQFLEGMDPDTKIGLTVGAIKIAYDNAEAGLPPVSIANKQEEEIMKTASNTTEAAHEAILADVGVGTSVPSLPNAVKFMDPVGGSTAGSIYTYIACDPEKVGKLAVRLKGDTLSIRLQPYIDQNHSSLATLLGLTIKKGYASGHMDISGEKVLERYRMIMRAGLSKWWRCNWSEQKVRKMGK